MPILSRSGSDDFLKQATYEIGRLHAGRVGVHRLPAFMILVVGKLNGLRPIADRVRMVVARPGNRVSRSSQSVSVVVIRERVRRPRLANGMFPDGVVRPGRAT